MKLMTKAIEQKIAKYPLYSQSEKGKDAIAICKFFFPMGRFTWYVLEGEKLPNGDYRFFGYVKGNDPLCDEYGYFLLSELQSIKVYGMGVERDLYFDPTPMHKIINN